jgi:hypothetical protein
VAEMSLDSFKGIENEASEGIMENFEKIKNLQQKIHSTLLFKKQ